MNRNTTKCKETEHNATNQNIMQCKKSKRQLLFKEMVMIKETVDVCEGH